MNRQEILDAAAKAVTTERQSAYGTPENSFSGIADYWNVYMAQRAEGPFTAHDVGMMLLLMKVRRTAVSPGKADNYVDLAGYGACVGEISTGESLQDQLDALSLSDAAEAVSQSAQMGGLDKAVQHMMSRVLDKQCDDTIASLQDQLDALPLGEAADLAVSRIIDIPPRQTFPDPPAGRKWHNPEGLTPEQVGVAEGWRLCLEDEKCDIPHQWMDSTDGQWEKGSSVPTTTFKDIPTTYRTKAPLP